MTVEIIINYNSDSMEEQLDKTLHSIKQHNNVPDKIKLCVNPPVEQKFEYLDFVRYVKSILNTDVECYLQIFTYHRDRIEDIINDAVQCTNADYYIFVNAGYTFTDNETLSEIKNKSVIFAEGVDDNFNEFSCSVKLHKHLGGFGKYHSLIEKIEYKLKMLEEAKNGTTELTEGGSDNL